MARKKDSSGNKKSAPKHEAYIEGSGTVVNERITDVLKNNYIFSDVLSIWCSLN